MPVKTNRGWVKDSGAIFLFIIAFAQFCWLYLRNSIALKPALADVLVSYLLMYGLFLFIKYSRRIHFFIYSNYVSIGFQSLLLAWVWIGLCRYILTHLFATEQNYIELWNTTFFLRALIGWIMLSCFTLIYFLSKELAQTRETITEEQQAEKLRKDAELFKLRQQLHPHFLFNSLNSINALIGREPQKARQMIQQLSDYLRNTIKKEDDSFISFREEMNDLRLYLAIEQVRFGHRLKIEENVELDCEDMKVPPFLLQPLVENAIKYGLYGTIGTVTIIITVIKIGKELIFTISNPYDADAVMTKGTGFGLESIRRRLYLLFARNDLLKIEQGIVPKEDADTLLQTFTATIIIPLTK
ncbi:hypothetical protein A9P82_13720 [Arachidicoccus ginsenosidimutans]|uniref:sensor histidine kinase n=1 Tax=Arachidicoccus sp. BS20 TaxID=1850526 RepID=UPI0007F08807|nr:histidine kinase [Arachidicoccus sp. BS20]ANI90256.1 hypothetical protein A9P82_13720 [Arachidicoccus sp. BS20]